MNKNVNVCANCNIENFCAANDWSLYDKNNSKCPNYKQGIKQYKQFLKEYFKDSKF